MPMLPAFISIKKKLMYNGLLFKKYLKSRSPITHINFLLMGLNSKSSVVLS